MRRGCLIREFHHDGADRSIQIRGVLLALQQIFVRLERAAGAGGCCNYDVERLQLLTGAAMRRARVVGAGIGTKSGQRHDAATAADLNAAHCGVAHRTIACTTGTIRRRDSAAGGRIGAVSSCGGCAACAVSAEAAAGAISARNCGASTRAS